MHSTRTVVSSRLHRLGTLAIVALGVVVLGCPAAERECNVNADCAMIERCTPQGTCVLFEDPNVDSGVIDPYADAGIPSGGDVDGGGLLRPPEEGVVLTRIALVPETLSAPVGTSIAFLAIGHADDGAMYDVTQDATWATSAPTVVAVDDEGRAQCNTEGTSSISATAFSVAAVADVTVTPAEPIDLLISPAEVVLATGQSVVAKVFSNFTDGVEREMTGVVTWATEDGNIATVNQGTITGVAPGTTSLVVILGALNARIDIVVEAAPLVTVALSTDDDGLNAGLLATFSAEGTFADAAVDTVTSRLVWTTSNTVLARPIAGRPGVIRTLAPGTVDVIATDPATGVSGTFSLTIDVIRLITLSVRDKHTLAAKTDGSVWGWGDNRSGQLGQTLASQCGTSVDAMFSCATSPVRIPNLPVIRAVAAGNGQSLALDEDGKVWGFGNNEYGQLGRGSFGGAINPTPAYVLDEDGEPLGTQSRIIQISCGFIHCLALDANGEAYAWGSGAQGRLGLGDESAKNVATRLSNLPRTIFVNAGQFHSVAVDEDRRLWTWGTNSEGQQGAGDHVLSPRLVTGVGATDLRGVIGGWGHTVTLNGSGVIAAVGRGTEGQLGRGTFTSSTTFAAMPLTGAVRLFAGNLHGGAVLASGQVRTWGYGAFGQLGNGGTSSSATPVTVVGPGTAPTLVDIQAVFGGADHLLAVGNDLTLYAWGRNENGQLGIGAWSIGDKRTRPIVLPPL